MKYVYCPKCLNKNNIKNENCSNCKNHLLLNNKYYLIDVLGENIGTTYLAVGRDLCISPRQNDIPPQQVVIKELSMKKMSKWKEEELFKRERLVLKNLKHKFIPKIIEEFDIKEGKRLSYYTVIEYINNDYDSQKKLQNKIEEKKVLNYISKLSDILNYLHSQNPPVIHRDIKLSNIIIQEDDIYLIDFGSVTNILKEEGGSTVAGTFGYMAPEQFLGKASKATDYYALGILALVMLTNKEPEEFLNNHEVDWESITISSKMKDIISKLLVYDYEKRISSQKELSLLLNKPVQERQFDIINFLTEYDQIIDLHKKATSIKYYDYLYVLTGIALTSQAEEMGGIFTSFFVIMAIIGFLIIKEKKNKTFITKEVNTYSYQSHKDIELRIAAMSLFCENNSKKINKNLFYNLLGERLNLFLDVEKSSQENMGSLLTLNKSLKYNKLTKDKEFIQKHISKTEKFREPYIRALQIRLNDNNNNDFNITNEEIRELMSDTEKKDLVKRGKWKKLM